MGDEMQRPLKPTQEGGLPEIRAGAGFNFTTAWTGVVGLGKAALGVDRASEVLIRQRRGICAACPKATAGSARISRCQVCSCFIHPKSSLVTEKCPLGNW